MKSISNVLVAASTTIATFTMASPLSPQSTPPPPVGGQLTWCNTQAPDYCTVGIFQNFDTGDINAYMFNYNCNLLNSTNGILTDSNFTFTWPGPQGYHQTGYIYVHDITGGADEFRFDGTLYTSGWSWESPNPIYYEYRAFRCGVSGK